MTGALLAVILAAAPARAQTQPTALVWIPAENFSHWSRVDDVFRRRDDLKLTIALTPAMATPIVKDILGPWLAAGRVEIAARIPGDPILPLVDARADDPRPDDALVRAADARREVEKRLGPTAGLVVGGGALDASLVGPIANAGASWVLVGPYLVAGSSSSWAGAGKTTFVPARAAPRGPLLGDDVLAPGAIAFDETADPDSALLAALAALPPTSRPASGWAPVSALISAAPGPRADALSVSQWPGWDGTPAAPEPAARLAWNAYGDAAKALVQYQNSGAADLRLLEEATALLHRAQDARFYRAPTSGVSALPPELRARLLAFYRRLKTTAPESLYSVNASTSATADDVPTGVHAASGPGWIAFDSPTGTLASAPAGAAGPEPWRLRGLRVEWNDQRVLFRLFVGRVAGAEGPRPVYDVYVDLNHVVGAGSIRLLDGRGAFAAARDAWEYALTVVDKDARLWRASADGDPEELTPLETSADPAAAEVRVAVPRETLRGNPAHWGYLALSLAEDPRRAGRSPAAPLVDANGAVLRGLLAPFEVQKALFARPGAPLRLPAARLDSAP
jgi:hypothetical protein